MVPVGIFESISLKLYLHAPHYKSNNLKLVTQNKYISNRLYGLNISLKKHSYF